jgi:hypothetical protein
VIAGYALGPAEELKELERHIRVSEIDNRFTQGLGGSDLRHEFNLC